MDWASLEFYFCKNQERVPILYDASDLMSSRQASPRVATIPFKSDSCCSVKSVFGSTKENSAAVVASPYEFVA